MAVAVASLQQRRDPRKCKPSSICPPPPSPPPPPPPPQRGHSHSPPPPPPPLRVPFASNNNFAIAVAFLMGILCGQRLGPFSERGVQPPPPIQPVATATATSATTTSSSISSSSTSSIHRSSSSSSSSIQFLGDVPIRSTSHTDPATGLAIRKQQLIEPFAVPNLAGISVATLVPRQTVELHDHRSMHEFFYVLEGTADVWVCGNVVNQNENEDQNEGQQWHRVGSGSLVHVAPNCVHSITVPETANTDLKMLVIGLTVGD